MIGSHQTLSYAKPIKWYMRPFHFIAKCQSKTYKEQYDLGVRLFDIRIRLYKDKWYVAHGSMLFDINLYEVLEYFNSKKDCIVRLMLEYNKEPKYPIHYINKFISEVGHIVFTYTNIKFYGFNCKWNGNKVFTYQNEPQVKVLQLVSSTTGNKLDDWFPALYTKVFKNDIKRINQYLKDDVYLLSDFI